MSQLLKVITYNLCSLFIISNAMAIEYELPQKSEDLIGQMQIIKTKYETTFADLGDTYSLGYTQLVDANPGVDPWIPGEGTDVLLPTRYILPDAPRVGIVINVAEYRLYYYPKGKKTVYTFPLGIGREGWGSPLGATSITEKVKDPSWVPPASIRKEHAADGDPLPAVVPPGPDNPLGPFKMRLGFRGYLIHGSNKQFGIGTRTSHGCFRMLNTDVTRLFKMVPVGTKVTIVNQPYKIGIEAGKIYLEAHTPLEEYPTPDIEKLIETAKQKYNTPNFVVDLDIAKQVVKHHDGIPVPIGNIDGTPLRNPNITIPTKEQVPEQVEQEQTEENQQEQN